MLDLKKIKVKIGEKIIIDDFSYTFEKGKIYAIMGPNGSGKSTLAHAIMGNPAYELSGVSCQVSGQKKKLINLFDLPPEERAGLGIFMSFQSPIALSGVRVAELLQLALKGKKSALDIRTEITSYASELGIPKELISRSLNDGLSGGERKKMEVLQAAILDKDIQIFDEIDTGVDVDAMKSIAKFLNKKKKNKTYIIITHYNRILKFLKPDSVLVLLGGKLVQAGDHGLAKKIEREGYKFLRQ